MTYAQDLPVNRPANYVSQFITYTEAIGRLVVAGVDVAWARQAGHNHQIVDKATGDMIGFCYRDGASWKIKAEHVDDYIEARKAAADTWRVTRVEYTRLDGRIVEAGRTASRVVRGHDNACNHADQWAKDSGHKLLEGGMSECGMFLYCVDTLEGTAQPKDRAPFKHGEALYRSTKPVPGMIPAVDPVTFYVYLMPQEKAKNPGMDCIVLDGAGNQVLCNSNLLER